MAAPLPQPAPADLPDRRLARLGFAVLIALLAGAATMYALILRESAGRHQDLTTYLQAATALRAGHPLYAVFLHHPFPDPTLRPAYIYPPVFALLVVGLSVLPTAVQPWIWLLLMQAAIAGAITIAMRAMHADRRGVILAAIATLTFYPLWIDALEGQANGIILLLTVAGIVLVARGDDRGGFSLGAAAAIKITPALLILWLAWERRWRAAAAMAVGALVLTGIGLLVRPADTITYFRDVVPQLASGTAYYSNQSLSGLYERLFTTNPYTDPWAALGGGIAVTIAVAAILLAVWAITTRTHDGLVRAIGFVPLLPLLSAVTWEHHMIVVLPVCWLVIVELTRRGFPIAETAVMGVILLGFDVLSRWRPGPAPLTPAFRHAQTGEPLVFLSANALLLATLALFLLTPWLLRAR